MHAHLTREKNSYEHLYIIRDKIIKYVIFKFNTHVYSTSSEDFPSVGAVLCPVIFFCVMEGGDISEVWLIFPTIELYLQ
jgi:hypothetical protein